MEKRYRNLKILTITLAICLAIMIGYYIFYLTPKSSWDLYMSIKGSDNVTEVEELSSDSVNIQLQQEDLNYIRNHPEVRLMQLTAIDFGDRSYIITTDPGHDRMEITNIEEIPSEVMNELKELSP
ncbi:hypothetical protein [Alkalibacillus salilacus]|uniref:Uncharacterized protein YxeA n=1 Tax=Alkalibacillus salilacus TaxID=284582 RepID=A0ABT9VIU5_9BACI|nr:hypothetical protein [Alkalibacillus salilacus]MDQ0160834.1 uncharacterized protein YxeA [Alkalibacillus salilacus]